MNGSIKIGTAFGIPIRLHWTFLVLLYAVALLVDGPPLVVLGWVIGLFGSVLLHELGHSLVAKHFGIRVIDITFWPLGGMARMTEMPESPKIEGLVAIAGPAVNFVLATFGFGAMLLAGLLGAGMLAQAAGVFTGVNLVMGTFNLVPAFPMDGGRILRAWCGRTTDWVSATEQAVAVGRVFAGIMFFGSLLLTFFSPHTLCGLPLIAIFVWVAGGRELLAVRMRHGISPFGVRVESVFQQSPFGQPGQHAGFEAERPVPPPASPHGGFTEDAIRQLERFRGRLRPPSGGEE